MEFMTAALSDIGIRRRTNQDSVLVEIADSAWGKVCLAAVCDGMGGLAKGELASAAFIHLLAHWFEEELPRLLAQRKWGQPFQESWEGLFQESRERLLQENWEKLVYEGNRQLERYGGRNQVKLGTTAAVLLVVGDDYYIMNVGDSRIYELSGEAVQLTKDQTFVQREIDSGRMTPLEARYHPKRSMLLQCIGSSPVIHPGFGSGKVKAGAHFLICSDGFAHVLEPKEMGDALGPGAVRTQEEMEGQLSLLAEWVKSRGEEDNISAVLVKIREEAGYA